MATTGIEYGQVAWNITSGCSPVSEGCLNCWAKPMAKRQAGRNGYPKDDPFKITLHYDRLKDPFKWKKPRTILVSFMGDLFHPDVPDEFINEVFNTMSNAQWFHGHRFMVLTKRPERMKTVIEAIEADIMEQRKPIKNPDGSTTQKLTFSLPLNNIWLGVTAENQARADERIPILLQIPAAKRFVSIEPMLGPVDIMQYLLPQVYTPPYPDRSALDWSICGGESGPGARPMHLGWVRDLRDQCVSTGTPFYFKQWGEWAPMGLLKANGKSIYLKSDGIVMPNIDYAAGKDEILNPIRMVKVGKKKAGRLLDGQEWLQMPGVIS